MKLFPKRELIIETKLGEYETVQKLEKFIRPKKSKYFPKFYIKFKDPDESKVYKFSVHVYFNILYIEILNFFISLMGNFFLYPRIDGIIKMGDKTTVYIVFKYPVLFIAAFYFYTPILAFILTFLAVPAVNNNDIFSIIFILFFFLYFQIPFIIGRFLFRRSLKNIKDFLIELLEASE